MYVCMYTHNWSAKRMSWTPPLLVPRISRAQQQIKLSQLPTYLPTYLPMYSTSFGSSLLTLSSYLPTYLPTYLQRQEDELEPLLILRISRAQQQTQLL